MCCGASPNHMERNMKSLLKKFVLLASVCALFAGCAREQSAKVAATVDLDFVNAYDAFEMAKNPRAKVASGDTVSVSETNLYRWNIKTICRRNLKPIPGLQFYWMNPSHYRSWPIILIRSPGFRLKSINK